jgi:hypothetical protein
MGSHQNNSGDSDDLQSPVLATKYAHIASNLVHTIAKNFIFITGLISALIVLALLDVLHAVGYTEIIPDTVYDSTIAIFSVILLIFIIYLLNNSFKSKRLLSSWADTFERNSIRTSMNIAMANKSKEEAIFAIAETVSQIGEPLRKYISSSKENYKNFLDVSIRDNNNTEDIFFDVLIDHNHMKIGHSNTSNDVNLLKQSLVEYGAVVIRIIDGTVDTKAVQSFYNSLSEYISLTKNKVGLALIIGDNIQENVDSFARHYENNKINYIVLVEKYYNTVRV